MRDASGFLARTLAATAALGALAALAVLHPWLAGGAVAALAALLLPPALLGLLLRVVKLRDRHASFRLVRPAASQAFPPAAFRNSSGGRNVS